VRERLQPAEKTPRNQRGRPFPKGTSGNPAGKPIGTRHKLTVLAEKLLEADAQAVVASVIKKAKAGDMLAARLVLERILPPRKDRPINLSLPKGNGTADSVSATITALITAMASGQVSPDEAARAASVLEAQRRTIELADVERRLVLLEAKLNARTN
jgi:uncharacterized protein DUF5681